MTARALDINCDLGESFGVYTLGDDAAVLPQITSANIACGFHAGDPHVMRRTVNAAHQVGLHIGAHPGLPDRIGFGRRQMAASPEEIGDMFVYQLGALRAFIESVGGRMHHVKMHGALTAMGLASEGIARAMVNAVRSVDPQLVWLTPSGTLTQIAREAGLRVVEDFYADRAYHNDLRLVSRTHANAVVTDVACVKDRLHQAIETATVTTVEGDNVPITFDSICVHGDTPGAVALITAVREVCSVTGIQVRPMNSTGCRKSLT